MLLRRKVPPECALYLTQTSKTQTCFINVLQNGIPVFKKSLSISCPIIRDSRRDFQRNVDVIYLIVTVHSIFIFCVTRRINRTRIFEGFNSLGDRHGDLRLRKFDARERSPL